VVDDEELVRSVATLMLTQSEATQLLGRRSQARLLASSGVDALRALLLQDPATRQESGGLYDNPAGFQGVVVLDDGEIGGQGKFTVLVPAVDSEGAVTGMRYGVEDESARVNLNALLLIEKQAQSLMGIGQEDAGSTDQPDAGDESSSGSGNTAGGSSAGGSSAGGSSMGGSSTGGSSTGGSSTGGSSTGGATLGSQLPSDDEQLEDLDGENMARDLLMALPGMTVEIADAILDWLDEDDEPREFGAELEYYSSLSPAYAPKNGPLETVEELLLVRGVTPQLLFGADVNRNGMVDMEEMAMAGQLTDLPERGWSAYFTLHSKEQNLNSLGEPRIDLNGDDLQALSDSLSLVFPPEWVTFIIAYRQSGPYDGEEEGEASAEGELDLTQQGKTKFTQVLDLIGAKVQVKFQGAEEAVVLRSPFSEDVVSMGTYMTDLMDNVTAVGNAAIPGRISLSQAPREVLLGIPGMSEEIVDQIISQRSPEPAVDDPSQEHETWLLTSGIVTLEEMRSLMPFVCGGGDVYRAQVVGYYEDGRASARL
ncbi:MAG: type II secretion system protein GspK, partial [Planctomycetes bacterium]|nr:type II secretion system protein GspK [Planctomycetota bacterium]